MRRAAGAWLGWGPAGHCRGVERTQSPRILDLGCRGGDHGPRTLDPFHQRLRLHTARQGGAGQAAHHRTQRRDDRGKHARRRRPRSGCLAWQSGATGGRPRLPRISNRAHRGLGGLRRPAFDGPDGLCGLDELLWPALISRRRDQRQLRNIGCASQLRCKSLRWGCTGSHAVRDVLRGQLLDWAGDSGRP